MKIMLTKNGQTGEITELVSDINLSESIDTIGRVINFSVPDINNKYITRLAIEPGDIVQMYNEGDEIIRAIVVNISREYPKRTVKGYDFGFYLKKNDVVAQFKEQSVSSCLKELFSKAGVGVGSICDMPAKVSKVYIDNVKNIIDDLIEIQEGNDGKRYYYELRGALMHVFQMPTSAEYYDFKPATDVATIEVTNKAAHGRGKYLCSMENMKNAVIAEVNTKKSGEMPDQIFITRDYESIQKYGLLTEVYKINSDDAENIQELAENRLKEKNSLEKQFSMDFIGNLNARAARIMHLDDEYTGITGDFRIQSIKHSISGGVHTMSCELVEV